MSYMIGIDGGGTKTRAILADNDGFVYSDVTAGPSNPNAMTESDLKKTFQQLFTKLNNEAALPLSHVIEVCAGIAGAGNEKNKEKISEFIQSFAPQKVRIYIETDAVNALYSGTYGDSGIVQIAGTGSISFGVNAHNQWARVGGWGYLLGDEGSGYAIGKLGVASALKAYDGREEETNLCQKIFDYFHVKTGESLVSVIYDSDSSKNTIASVAKLVFDAYMENDTAAKRIIGQASNEIALNISTLYHKLFMDYDQVKVVLCGGLFKHSSILPPLIKEEIQNKHREEINIILPDLPPVAGSVMSALIKSGGYVGELFIENATAYFEKHQEEN